MVLIIGIVNACEHFNQPAPFLLLSRNNITWPASEKGKGLLLQTGTDLHGSHLRILHAALLCRALQVVKLR